MNATMMDRQLTVDLILERGSGYFGSKEIVTRTGSGTHRYTYRDFGGRAKKLANALRHQLKVADGERIATFCWNHYQHLELYFGIPITGAVLHTVNLRLFAEQIVYIFNHAEDRVLFLDRSLAPLLAPLWDQLPLLTTLVLIGEGADPAPAGKAVIDYETLLAGESDEYEYLDMDEKAPLGLCYTSGTTGDPKGVVYTHRSTLLHTLGSCLTSTLALSESDTVMPVVPMFHANAWGLPYVAVMVGAKLVLPGPRLDPPSLVELMAAESVNFAAGVPTIWAGILSLLDQKPGQVPTLERMGVGGSAVPVSMIEGFQERHGIKIMQAWGMTETSPAGTIATVKSYLPQTGPVHYSLRASQGLPFPLVEVKAIDPDGNPVPRDGQTMGDLVVRGPWIAAGYFRNDRASAELLTPDGWMRTGDVVTIDPEGYMRIMDRAKDLIKSGGEWISSVDLENALMGHPAVAEAAVIAVPDAKWQERPLAFVVVKGEAPSADEFNRHLLEHFAKWQLPDSYVIVAEIPKTSVGKFNKKVLRQKIQAGN